MSDRKEMGHFKRNGRTFNVFVDYSPFGGKIDSIIIARKGGESTGRKITDSTYRNCHCNTLRKEETNDLKNAAKVYL